jgi:hypothetical protein
MIADPALRQSLQVGQRPEDAFTRKTGLGSKTGQGKTLYVTPP